ncbi:MAG TPA: PQQ-binding-like beta-propeller repeat protein [Armatimonadota bacterium]|nr:PQQ-binding-like beta-propeller repeat protein [Armatimonadota bacterium]
MSTTRGPRSAVVFPALVAVACMMLCVPGHCAPNWPMWMENATHTPTPQLQPTGRLRAEWKAECGGIFGSPVVYEGAVYFASRDGYLYAVDDGTGERLWREPVSVPGAEILEGWADQAEATARRRYGETGVIATPAVDQDCVYVGGLDGHFQARNRRSGELVWEQDFEEAMASSPLLLNGMVVVATREGQLVAMDTADGFIHWSCDALAAINSSPACAEGKVIVGTSEGVIAVDAATGELIWECALPDSGKIDASPCIADGRVYVASWGGTVFSLGLNDGEVLWARDVSDKPIFASPVCAGGLVYVSTTAGMLVALESDTGVPAWQTALLDRREGKVAVYASPVVCGPVVLAGCNADRIHVLGARTGDGVGLIVERLYQFVHSAPAVTDDAVYVASEHSLGGMARGRVAKLVCSGDDPWVRREVFPWLACRELRIVGDGEPAWATDYGDWPLVGEAADLHKQALDRLVELGLIKCPREWNKMVVQRDVLAAFYYNLFWDPNPFRVRLPEFEPAELDTGRWRGWWWNAPQLVVGLGVMEAPGGTFVPGDSPSLSELRWSLQQARKLLDELPREQQ